MAENNTRIDPNNKLIELAREFLRKSGRPGIASSQTIPKMLADFAQIILEAERSRLQHLSLMKDDLDLAVAKYCSGGISYETFSSRIKETQERAEKLDIRSFFPYGKDDGTEKEKSVTEKKKQENGNPTRPNNHPRKRSQKVIR